eukprot:422485-Alexandrium_andersonii.AAC.1
MRCTSFGASVRRSSGVSAGRRASILTVSELLHSRMPARNSLTVAKLRGRVQRKRPVTELRFRVL